MKAAASWVRVLERSFKQLARGTLRAGRSFGSERVKGALGRQRPPAGEGDWIAGMALGAGGARRYRLYRPPGVAFGERLPLMVMLHGCGQDAKSFAQSTRMNLLAARERFLVLYPEQDRMANPSGCWNWFDIQGGRALGEAQLILKAVEQVCLLYGADRARIVVAGLSAGASMAALLVSRHPDRFQALVMHSGVPPGVAHSTLSALAAMHGRGAASHLPAAAPSRPVAWPGLLVIHGADDGVVAASNGRDAVRVWADAAGARAGPSRSLRRGQRYPMTVTEFAGPNRAAVTLVEIEQLGHAWSGGAASQPHGDPRGPDASRMAWSFASRQFRTVSLSQ